eukprot:NODE_582_length_5738_cov_0.811314.p7 type:complete len:112 gc:universal NODE_582_length_5738_cov_0.811314:5371-5036(-)
MISLITLSVFAHPTKTSHGPPPAPATPTPPPPTLTDFSNCYAAGIVICKRPNYPISKVVDNGDSTSMSTTPLDVVGTLLYLDCKANATDFCLHQYQTVIVDPVEKEPIPLK